jgi:4-diphosphocytidyl-2-C-methyl-D-erythritol kinase
LIAYPNIVCSTKKIYSKNKKFTTTQGKLRNHFKNKNHLISYLKRENNDLEKTVVSFHPKIKKIINFIQLQKDCYFSRITGSGSACIGIFSNTKAALYTQKLIKLKFPTYWCVVSKTI